MTLFVILVAAAAVLAAVLLAAEAGGAYTNSLRMEMLPIPPGTFTMGETHATPPDLGADKLFPEGDWDEKPAHKVTISYPFHMSRTAVTAEQFRQFRGDYPSGARFAINISWYDAAAFCRWLSEKEGKPYRLPTEAEWEYACRAGATGLFSSGDRPPASGEPNAWGLVGMHHLPAEWCLDWHDLYPADDLIDPVGPDWGFCKVVRGGGIQEETAYYARSANRGGLAPNFPPPLPAGEAFEPRRAGRAVQPAWNIADPREVGGEAEAEGHFVGFRVVQAEMPMPFFRQCLRRNAGLVSIGPDPGRPYFRVRPMLAVPPDNASPGAAAAVGMHGGILGHNHSPALAVCPNGDVVAVHFTACSSSTEYLPNIAFIATRLRFGADRWDSPDFFLDFPDVTEESPLLWNDGGVLHLFTGGVGLNCTPFKWCSSSDSGGTWDEIKYPVFAGVIGPHTAQPITNAFRDASGTIYVASDGASGDSLLWASRDEGKTWFDTGGRTAGRHTAFVLLKDGSILGLGGKKTDIDGYMPQAVSCDGGKSWQVSRSPFPALGNNQRPTVLRLASGRIFFASDFQSRDGSQPTGITQRGAFVGLSEDEGKSWHVKPLAGGQRHEGNVLPPRPGWGKAGHDDATLGYTVAAQGPNGIIHLITTMNHPCLHFELNEAWILDDRAGLPGETPVTIKDVQAIEEKYPSGKTRCTYSGGVTSDGRWLLDGQESWFYQNGQMQYQATWRAGRKAGRETYWAADGKAAWTWEHHDDGGSVWTQYWPNGEVRSRSTWWAGRCEGIATLYDRHGNVVSQRPFADGMPVA